MAAIGRPPTPLAARFPLLVSPCPVTGCWWWAAAYDRDGYGLITVVGPRRLKKAHRVAWELYRGAIPAGLCVLHACDADRAPGDTSYRACVNPAHLFLGSNQENIADRDSKGRQAAGDRSGPRRYPESYPRGEAHGGAKITAAVAAAIKQSHCRGTAIRALAREFGLARSTIKKIVTGKTWRHVR